MRIVAGRFKGRRLPEARAARPVGARLKTSLFGVLMPWLPGARVLDLYAGVGGLGLEALSRGAERVVFVEGDRYACRVLEAWLVAVGAADEARVLCRTLPADAVPEGPFDLVFLDPPFAVWDGPEARELLGLACCRLAPEGRIVVKLPAQGVIPEDSRWRVVRRTAVSSAAYALLTAPEA